MNAPNIRRTEGLDLWDGLGEWSGRWYSPIPLGMPNPLELLPLRCFGGGSLTGHQMRRKALIGRDP
jgi:hypothetical protein